MVMEIQISECLVNTLFSFTVHMSMKKWVGLRHSRQS